MADKKICDCCGGENAKPVQISVTIVGAVTPDMPTSRTHGMDLCDDCVDEECGKMHGEAMRILKRDIPIHKELIALRDAMPGLAEEKDSAVIARDSLKEGSAAHKSASLRVDAGMAAIEANEARQTELLASAV